MMNIKATMLFLVLGLTYWSNVSAIENGPLLISEIPSDRLYSEERIADVKSQSEAALKSDSEDFLVNEYLLFKKVGDVNPEALSQKDIDFLKQVAIHKPTAYKQHPEGPIAVPIFDISSLAQHKLLLNDIHLKQPEFIELLQTNPAHFTKLSLENSVNVQAAKASLKVPELLSIATETLLVDNYKQHENPNSLVLLEVLAETGRNYKAAEALLNSQHRSPLKHQLLSRLDQYFSEHQQESLLKDQIFKKSDLASQALIEYGKLPQSVMDVDILYANLADKRLGSSSAFALSKVIRDSSDYSTIANYIKQHGSSRHAVANCLLALKLANTGDSKAQLRNILEQGDIQFEDIKAEVSSWIN